MFGVDLDANLKNYESKLHKEKLEKRKSALELLEKTRVYASSRCSGFNTNIDKKIII